MNGYSYANDNAVTLADPSGQDPIPNCPAGDVACFNCSYSGNCSAPGSDGGGATVPAGTPTINPCWGDCGTLYMPITPHVRVADNDSRLKGMTAAWNAWLKSHDMPLDWQPGSTKVMVGGLQYRAAGDGNAVVDDPAAAVSIKSQGSTGPIDITGSIEFGGGGGGGE